MTMRTLSLLRGLGATSLATALMAPALADDGQEVKFSTKGGLKLETADGNFKFEVGGRLQVDGAAYDNDRVKLGSGAEIRRARLGVAGTLFRDWHFKTEYDFAEDRTRIQDAYISYSGFEPLGITVGNYKEPFSLEELTSSRFITFMERALPNALAPGRNLGIGIHTYWPGITLAAGLFSEGINSGGGETSSGYGATGRLTYAPIATKTEVVHLGIAGGYRRPNSSDTIGFENRPESHVTDVRYLDTGDIEDVDDFTRLGLEGAVVWGPFSAQAEYLRADVSRKSGLGDVDFNGYYAFASWFVTGESRNYEPERAIFGRITPKSSYGAWELALRYSRLDLDDKDIQGGDEDNVTFGVNWYPNRYTRLMFNYVYVNAEGGPRSDDNPNIFQMRAQVDF